VVFNPHPSAKAVSAQNVRWINAAIVAAGGPPDLVTATPEPTIAGAQQLMNHPRVRILMVTGGPGVVEEARKSRKRAILAGPGNPPVVVDATADLELAGREIVRGASFDNNVICTDEKVVFVVASVADRLLEHMTAHRLEGARAPRAQRLEPVIFAEPGEPGRAGRSTRAGSAGTPAPSWPRSASARGPSCGWRWPTCRPSTPWCGRSR
jgi:aldehyde dehydrogenase